jgi:hypothetical protein
VGRGGQACALAEQKRLKREWLNNRQSFLASTGTFDMMTADRRVAPQ